MEFIKEPKEIWFQKLPELFDKFEIKSIWAWTFLTTTVPNRPPNFFLMKAFHQQLSFLLSHRIKTDPIQLWSALMGLIESLLEEPMDFRFHTGWFINPGAINNHSIHSVVSAVRVKQQVEVPGVTIHLYDTF